jgi:hypothetical protein
MTLHKKIFFKKNKYQKTIVIKTTIKIRFYFFNNGRKKIILKIQ